MGEEAIPYTSVWQTEFYAVFLMRYGYIPSAAYGRHYSSPVDVYRRGQVNVTRRFRLEGYGLNELNHPEWKRCPKCGCYWPETAFYWHRNGVHPDGAARYQSACRYCRSRKERRRYRQGRELQAAAGIVEGG